MHSGTIRRNIMFFEGSVNIPTFLINSKQKVRNMEISFFSNDSHVNREAIGAGIHNIICTACLRGWLA